MVIMCWFSCELNKSVAVGVDDHHELNSEHDDAVDLMLLTYFCCCTTSSSTFLFCLLFCFYLMKWRKCQSCKMGNITLVMIYFFVCFLFICVQWRLDAACTCCIHCYAVMKLLVWDCFFLCYFVWGESEFGLVGGLAFFSSWDLWTFFDLKQ